MTPESLDHSDALALLKLTNRLHEVPAIPTARHECMLEELCTLTEACAGISALLDAPQRQWASVAFLVYHGIDDLQQQSAINQYLRVLDAPLSAPPPLVKVLESRCWEPRDGDGDHLAHDLRALCAPVRLGPAIFSSMPLRGTTLVSLLSLHRPLDDARPFTARQRRMVEMFHSQIGWTFRSQTPAEPDAAARLSPRQQQTLRHLLAGESEKQIAQKLSRSPHTVHTYVKAIYRNFRVSSRGELLSLFVK